MVDRFWPSREQCGFECSQLRLDPKAWATVESRRRIKRDQRLPNETGNETTVNWVNAELMVCNAGVVSLVTNVQDRGEADSLL
jgi:hypothetical protein